jgi:hypothetical protein
MDRIRVKGELQALATELPAIARGNVNAIICAGRSLARIEDEIGYNSQAAHESGEGGQTPLEFMVDQVYGAMEHQQAFGGLQGGTWEELIGEVNEVSSRLDYEVN